MYIHIKQGLLIYEYPNSFRENTNGGAQVNVLTERLYVFMEIFCRFLEDIMSVISIQCCRFASALSVHVFTVLAVTGFAFSWLIYVGFSRIAKWLESEVWVKPSINF